MISHDLTRSMAYLLLVWWQYLSGNLCGETLWPSYMCGTAFVGGRGELSYFHFGERSDCRMNRNKTHTWVPGSDLREAQLFAVVPCTGSVQSSSLSYLYIAF